MNINLYRAFRTGLRDGLDSPWQMNVGMTYDSDHLQAAWDHGANIGQWLGRHR